MKLSIRLRSQMKALTVAVSLSSRYITDRFLPDKAIDVVDEAAASKVPYESIFLQHLMLKH